MQQPKIDPFEKILTTTALIDFYTMSVFQSVFTFLTVLALWAWLFEVLQALSRTWNTMHKSLQY